jgi:GNAT superfamily N-acetyltransferase
MSDAPADRERQPGDRVAGLCATCVHLRIVVSSRGARFYMCGRAADDPAYRRYPPIPVRACAGFEPLAAPESPVSTPSPSAVQIRQATEADVPLILSFIRQLAEYERLLHAVKATEETLRATLFGPRPSAEVLIAESPAESAGGASGGPTPVGFALFFQNYSTFLAQPGIYLEDLFVIPAARGRGVGRDLLQRLSQIAIARGCGRLEWAVLDWNAPAVGFYRRMGAVPMEEWTVFRLTGHPLAQLAGPVQDGSVER